MAGNNGTKPGLANDQVKLDRRVLGKIISHRKFWPYFPRLIDRDWTCQGSRKRYKAILRAASLPTDRKHMLHCMRRSTASFYEAAGGNATDLLDHSSRDITKRYYLDTRVLPMQGPAMMEFRPKAG